MSTTILVLGPGCTKCALVAQHAAEAVAELGLDASIEKITDINQFMAHGVMMTPGLVIDGKVRASGKVPSTEQIKGWLS